MKVARRSGEDEQIEAKLELYADQLMTWPEQVALACLGEHPKRSIYWPAWKELEDLRVEFEERRREAREMLPAPGEPESFAARRVRLGITAMRLNRIGTSRWRPVMERHGQLSDQAVLEALERLERGRPAVEDADPQAPFARRRDWDDFTASMASLRDPRQPHIAREALVAMGEKIEERQRPHAEAIGWA